MPEEYSQPIANLTDSHAHLTVSEYCHDLDEIISRAQKSQMYRLINMGTNLQDSQEGIEIAHRHDFILTTVGIHPQESFGITEKEIEKIELMAKDSRVIAIGEIGLDYYREYVSHAQQISVFQQQLALAQKQKLPVVIHSRQAEEDTQKILSEWASSQSSKEKLGAIHCFNGSLGIALYYIRMGFYISLGAYIGYPSSKALREVVRQLPLESILLETDCPYLPPQGKRGQRNEPSYIEATARELSIILQKSSEEIATVTTENCRNLFRI